MEINGVTIQMLPAASGDCIYLEFPDPDFRILIDGGYAKTYHKYLKKFLLKLAAEGKRLNLIVVTHIDAMKLIMRFLNIKSIITGIKKKFCLQTVH